MAKSCQEIADRIMLCFRAFNEIEAQIQALLAAEGGYFCSFHFEVRAEMVQRLREIFSRDSRLWNDFLQAIHAHRRSTHWTILLEHVYSVTQLKGKLGFLELGFSCPSASERRRLAEHVNCIDGEIGFSLDLADRRGLAARINKEAEFPLIDGLSLRGLMYIFGEHVLVWRDFQTLVEESVVAAREPSKKEVGIRPPQL